MLDVRYDLHHGALKTLSQNQVRARTNPTHHSNTGTANSRPSRVQGARLGRPSLGLDWPHSYKHHSSKGAGCGYG